MANSYSIVRLYYIIILLSFWVEYLRNGLGWNGMGWERGRERGNTD